MAHRKDLLSPKQRKYVFFGLISFLIAVWFFVSILTSSEIPIADTDTVPARDTVPHPIHRYTKLDPKEMDAILSQPLFNPSLLSIYKTSPNPNIINTHTNYYNNLSDYCPLKHNVCLLKNHNYWITTNQEDAFDAAKCFPYSKPKDTEPWQAKYFDFEDKDKDKDKEMVIETIDSTFIIATQWYPHMFKEAWVRNAHSLFQYFVSTETRLKWNVGTNDDNEDGNLNFIIPQLTKYDGLFTFHNILYSPFIHKQHKRDKSSFSLMTLSDLMNNTLDTLRYSGYYIQMSHDVRDRSKDQLDNVLFCFKNVYFCGMCNVRFSLLFLFAKQKKNHMKRIVLC